MADRLIPVIDDPDTGGFFAAAARDELVVCTCGSCGAVLHLPRPYCDRCGERNVAWKRVEGRGRLYSWTTIEHQVHPTFPVPYTVILVELAGAPEARLMGYLPGRPELTAGMELGCWFEPVADDTKLPQWRPAGDSETE